MAHHPVSQRHTERFPHAETIGAGHQDNAHSHSGLYQPSGDARGNRDKATYFVGRGTGQNADGHNARFPSQTQRPTATVLVISISAVAPNIPEYDWIVWQHWTDSDGDCRNTRQQVLADESVTPVTFETDRKCRIETGRWYGAFTGKYEEVPEIVDIDRLVPLKNAHNSGGWAWPPTKKNGVRQLPG